MLLNWVYVCPKNWCFLQLLVLKYDLTLVWLGGRSARWALWVFPASDSVVLWKLCVRGFFSSQPDWELEIHMVTDNSQLSVKLFYRKCYMTDVSTTALFQTDGGKKRHRSQIKLVLMDYAKKLSTCSTFWETSKYNISIENTVYDSAKNM